MGTAILVALVFGGYLIYILSLRWQRRDEKAEEEAWQKEHGAGSLEEPEAEAEPDPWAAQR